MNAARIPSIVAAFALAACSAANDSGANTNSQPIGNNGITGAPGTSTGQSSGTPSVGAPGSAGASASTGTPGSMQQPSTMTMTPGSTPVTMTNPGNTPVVALPCEVKKAVTTSCGSCHGATPIGGAPMSLLSATDFQKPAVTKPELKVYQLALMRLMDPAKPMPPGGAITAPDKTTIVNWLNAGAVGDDKAQTCDLGTTTTMTTVPAGTQGLTARPGETCYGFQSHNGMTPDDKTPYQVPAGEHYEQFYFKVPWPADSVATRFGSKLDARPVLHHWLLYTTTRSASVDGTHEIASGSQIGDDAELLAGWALGGDDIIFPDDMALELPAGGMLNASWHFYNRSSAAVPDASQVQVCVVNKAMRKNIAAMNWLGTEDLGGVSGMPAHQESNYSGTCQNHTNGPVTIWGFLPHMHQLGTHMKSVLTKTDGTTQTIFDHAFDFNQQSTYPLTPLVVMQPGDRLTSTCTFNNTTDSPVPYGPSSNQEMCYQFTIAYPAGALDNHVFSLTGARNSCWGD